MPELGVTFAMRDADTLETGPLLRVVDVLWVPGDAELVPVLVEREFQHS